MTSRKTDAPAHHQARLEPGRAEVTGAVSSSTPPASWSAPGAELGITAGRGSESSASSSSAYSFYTLTRSVPHGTQPGPNVSQSSLNRCSGRLRRILWCPSYYLRAAVLAHRTDEHGAGHFNIGSSRVGSFRRRRDAAGATEQPYTGRFDWVCRMADLRRPALAGVGQRAHLDVHHVRVQRQVQPPGADV